jgi:cellulose synthase/poly-beta-1,6-N-acetylglucosamine synthase-like glycosyltransferase
VIWILYLVFFVSGYFVLHTYVIYPFWMLLLAGRHPEPAIVPEDSGLPKIALLIAAYNEEKVMEEKLASIFRTDYPATLIEVFVGSDCSSDRTDEIVLKFSEEHPQVRLVRFNERTGKPLIINHLVKYTDADILVLSDADTFFLSSTLRSLVSPFSHPGTGGVQARFRSRASGKHDVASQELRYNDREVLIKKGQSVHGAVIGAYGACYALRRSLYAPVPSGFLVDDFYIFMKVLEKGFKTVLAENAVCHLEVSGESRTEFRRKARIGTGNYQNFFRLRYFWNPFRSRASFYYWSHKVLRWFTPFFLLAMFLCNAVLAFCSSVFFVFLCIHLLAYLLVVLDLLLKSAGFRTGPFRFASHFAMMNLALLTGFFRFLKGQKSSAW